MNLYLMIAGVIGIAPLLLSQPVEAKTIKFSGHEWRVKTGYSAPGKNHWRNMSDAVYVDKRGALHLKIIQHKGVWYSSEVSMPSLGYGTYEFDIESRIDNLDINTVASPFLYKDDEHEIDIEFTKWKVPDEFNTYHSIQPVKTTGAHKKLVTKPKPGIPFTARIIWEPEKITLQNSQSGKLLNTWEYVGEHNYVPGQDRLHINHWLIDGTPPSDNKPKDFVVRAFRHKPYTGPIPEHIALQMKAEKEVGAEEVVPDQEKVEKKFDDIKEMHMREWRAKLEMEQAARRKALIEKIGEEEYRKFEEEMRQLNSGG